MTRPGLHLLFVDLRKVDFIDASALGVLLAGDARMSAEGRRTVVVRRDDGVVARLLEVTGLDRHFEWVLHPSDLRKPAQAAGPRHLRRMAPIAALETPRPAGGGGLRLVTGTPSPRQPWRGSIEKSPLRADREGVGLAVGPQLRRLRHPGHSFKPPARPVVFPPEA